MTTVTPADSVEISMPNNRLFEKRGGIHGIVVFLRGAGRGTSMPGMAVIWCDGDWKDGGTFALPASDRGVILGFALFETMTSWNGRPRFVADHLRRIGASCERLGWDFPELDLETIGRGLLEKNGLASGRARLRLTMTAGSAGIFDSSRAKDAKLWIVATPLDVPPESIGVTVSPWKRNSHSPLAGMKTACYADNILALDHARRAGFGETLFFNTDGHVCEAATSNVFIVKDGRISTPDPSSGCLPGVARSVVLRIVEKAGIPVSERTLTAEDLAAADEIFLTSSTRGPIPVARLDERRFPANPVSESVRGLWQDEICRV